MATPIVATGCPSRNHWSSPIWEKRRDVNLVEAHRVFSPTRKTGTESQQTTRSYAAGHFTEKFGRIRCHRKFRRIRCHRIFRRIRCHRKFRRIRCHRIFCRKLQPRRRRGAPPKGEKSGDGDPAPPRGERREDGNLYTPAAPWSGFRCNVIITTKWFSFKWIVTVYFWAQ